MSTIKAFYLNKEPNPKGLYLKDIWNFSDWEFDNTHDFIQWMFPLELESKHSDLAPVVSKEDFSEMVNNPQIKENLLNSLYMAENVWGLDVHHKKMNRARPRTFKSFDELNWPTHYHHNYIRISRVIHCLRLFQLENEAKELLEYLEKNLYSSYEHLVGQEVFNSWQEAFYTEPSFKNKIEGIAA